MSSMGDAVTAAVLTALATTTVLELTVKPLLEGRSTRIKAAMQARYELGSHVAVLLAACDRLEAAAQVSAQNTITTEEEVDGQLVRSTRFGAHQAWDESRRWWEQVDGATKALVDGYESGGASATWAALRGLLGEFAVTARWVYLAELDDRNKIAYLRALAKPAQALFFATWPAWLRSATSHKALEALQAELRAVIDRISEFNLLGIERPTLYSLRERSERSDDIGPM
ncbi:hypothetical protein [Kitasatospora sp. NPDC087315]|uniref:hypothetical protein n=1 Tax=Kitasatospora sp. NPDC087315 TaxID=3364069 RepID=UPI0038276F2F